MKEINKYIVVKQLNTYIIEKLKINKDSKNIIYSPKTKYELISIIIDRVKKNGIRKMFNGDLNNIDVSSIEDMSGLISIAHRNYDIRLDRLLGNVDISKWDFSNVKTAQSMFFGCKSFNCNLSNWNIENLENATAMFAGCQELSFDISKWNPVKLKDSNKTYKMIINTKLEKQDWMR